MEHGNQTQALVIDAKHTSTRGYRSYYNLTYEFEIDEILYTGKTTDQYTDGKEYIDKYITITYLPDGQSCASNYDSYEFNAFIMALVFGTTAVIVFLITILIIVKSRRKLKTTGSSSDILIK